MAPVTAPQSLLWLLLLLPAPLFVNAARPTNLEEAAVQPRGIFTRQRRPHPSHGKRASLADIVRQRRLQQAEARAARLADDFREQPSQYVPSSLADVSEFAEADRHAQAESQRHPDEEDVSEFDDMSEAPTRQSMDLEGGAPNPHGPSREHETQEDHRAEERETEEDSHHAPAPHGGVPHDEIEEEAHHAPSPNGGSEGMANHETEEGSQHVENPTEHDGNSATGEVFMPGVSDDANANLLNPDAAPSPSTEGLQDFSFGQEPPVETKDLFKATAQEGQSLNEAAESIDKQIHSVDQAIDKIHGAMATYHESINGLSKSFGDVRKMAGEMKVGMNGEFEERERQRLCSFENLDKMLKGEAYVPCDKTPRLATNNVETQPGFEETPAAGVRVQETGSTDGMRMFQDAHDGEHHSPAPALLNLEHASPAPALQNLEHRAPSPAVPRVDGDAASGEVFIKGLSDNANAHLLEPPGTEDDHEGVHEGEMTEGDHEGVHDNAGVHEGEMIEDANVAQNHKTNPILVEAHTTIMDAESNDKKEHKEKARSEELRFDSVVAVNPGMYEVALAGDDGEVKAKSSLVALNHESYVVFRTGVEAQHGKAYAQELVVYPESDASALHSSAISSQVMACARPLSPRKAPAAPSAGGCSDSGASAPPATLVPSEVTFALGETDRGKPCAVQVQVEDDVDEEAGAGGEAGDGQANDDEAMDDGEGASHLPDGEYIIHSNVDWIAQEIDWTLGLGACAAQAAPPEKSTEALEVEAFLADLGLQRYVSGFIESGFDCMEVVSLMEESHMRAIGMKTGDALKLRQKLKEAEKAAAEEKEAAEKKAAEEKAAAEKAAADEAAAKAAEAEPGSTCCIS